MTVNFSPQSGPETFLRTADNDRLTGNLQSGMACEQDREAFDHAIDVALDPETLENTALTNRAREHCNVCPVQAPCLELGLTALREEAGILGGKNRQERQAIGLSLPGARVAVRSATSELVSPSSATKLERPRISLDNAFHPQHAEIVAQLADPIINERVFLLIPQKAANVILQEWIRVVEEGDDEPRRYNFSELALKAQMSEASLLRRGSGRGFHRAEQIIIETVTKLADSSFDYEAWHRTFLGFPPRSPLSFLARIGEPIPPRDSLDELRILSRQRLEQLPSDLKHGSQPARMKATIAAAYGLEGQPPLTYDQLAELYGPARVSMKNTLYLQLQRLRETLGRS